MDKRFSILAVVFAIGLFIGGFVLLNQDPNGSKTISNNNDNVQVQPNLVPSFNPVIYEDHLDGANDTNALKSRGYKVWYRGTGPQGLTATWFQGNSSVFPAFEGPATGYVAANYNVVTGANNIDSWLVLPYTPGGLQNGDSLYFYARGPLNSTYPDSIRVMVSASDSVPEGTWVELGRFKCATSGSWEHKGYMSSVSGSHARFAIRYNVVNGGPSGTNSDFIGVDYIQVVRSAPAILYDVPELMYYKFENNPAPLMTPNTASSPVGTNPSPILTNTPLGAGGQFPDTCLNGNSSPAPGNQGGVNTGWNTVLPANWTISFWLGPNIVDGNPSYVFGDPGATSFRCFYGGAAGVGNLLLRGPFTDILITGVGVNATVVTIVWNGSSIIVYKDGTLFNTFARSLSASTGSGFYIGSYNTTFVSHLVGKLDEFRFYNRALTAAEISGTWNMELPVYQGVNSNQNNVPVDYNLSQNYPNPFNPTTNISYTLPKTGNVKLVVFDILGREISTLVNGVKTAGTHVVNFNASNLSSGVYFYRIEAGDYTATKKMMLVK